MDMDTNKLRSKVSALNGALDNLEAQLEPLLAQSLPESVVGLETIQQAKLQVALPYLLYDLIFIYLKTRGIDPKTHPVVSELDRIRQYFDKIKNAEDPAKRTTAVDKAAANRFIKHAIAQVKAQRPPGDNEGPSHIHFNDDGSQTRVPVKVTSKMVARAQYEKELAELGSEEENDLQVVEDVEMATEQEVIQDMDATTDAIRSDKGKGKAVDTSDTSTSPSAGQKRRRPPIDPFAGYGDDANGPSQPAQVLAAEAPPEDTATQDGSKDSSGRSTPLSISDAAKERKATKRARKKAKRKESSG